MKGILSLVFISLVLSTTACSPTGGKEKTSLPEQTGNRSTVNYTPEEFKNHVNDPNVIVLDVRTPGEVREGYIKGAVNIDWNSPNFKDAVKKLDKSKTILVYCAVGGRSAKATEVILKEGFGEVHHLTGGIDAWKSKGFEIEKK